MVEAIAVASTVVDFSQTESGLVDPHAQFIDTEKAGWKVVRKSSPIDDEPSTWEMMILQQESGALDFWNDPAEDIYSEADGDPA
jgi:hypothetical protein